MKIHEYREMMRYLTRKPLSEQELQIASNVNQQMLDSIPPTPVASGEQRVLDGQLELAEGGRVDFEKAGRALTKNNLEQILKKGNLKNFKGTTEELSNLAKQYIENYAGGSRTVASEQLDYYTNELKNTNEKWKETSCSRGAFFLVSLGRRRRRASCGPRRTRPWRGQTGPRAAGRRRGRSCRRPWTRRPPGRRRTRT